MKLGIISDLHLEFYDTNFAMNMIDYLNAFKGKIDWLIIAGDIHSNKLTRDYFLSQLEVPFKFVLGNHDYYGSTHYDDFFDEDGIVGGCLWTNFGNNPLVEMEAQKCIYDFKAINNWNVSKAREEFEYQKYKIFNSPSEIVVTHFPPSLQSVTERFKGDSLNPYFCNDLDNEILYSNKKLWIHGHVHSDHDYMIGDCRVVSYVLGYPREVKKRFDLKIVDV